MSLQKAYRLHSYGGPECVQLDDVEVPEPGPSQTLVAVHTVGMNPFDWKIREGFGRMMGLQLPTTLGVDFVGTVEANGDGASRLAAGERVMAISNTLGAFAEYIAVDEATLARVPEGLSDVEAAALPIPGLTAWQTVHLAGEPGPGMRVLINGASGIVGSLAVQLVKAAGGYVIGVASGKNRDYVLKLGADEFLDYQGERVENRFTDVDLVLDYALAGSPDDTARLWTVLTPGGAVVSVADPTILDNVPAGYRGYFHQAVPDAAALEEIANRVVAGDLTITIAQVFPRDRLIEAMELNKAGGTTGRLVVDFTDTTESRH
ncbi:NADPH:quinone reductase [Mycolicibacterium madagascariense]|uniref:NADPH:quinone reductase n=1 Tax=Mycolicibacterium madagascariense TaxID=212765 RepID=A0A7I7XB63_9MYCO|nr:NADP-dependent oxidoreductase [Mycolicibacterium madagascariense]MCV7013430.1 NADP-dependent oxidoreductase [Mycolicibacterium madagascariense]BBZ25851.1 NADPH:quinone reductase [Mycolicibacterium madagascariense]